MPGIYIHIPFCVSKCNYCNFFSLASPKDMRKFTEAVIREMQLQMGYLGGESVSTIYFGGGTPSMLPFANLRQLIDEVRALFTVTKNAEITLEANPDNISFEYLRRVADIGINRISLGIQSFHDADLEYLGRIHTAKNALHMLDELIEGPVKEISADLIYGIPTLTDAHWKKNIELLTQRHVKHISAYALTVEPKTPLSFYINKSSRMQPEDSQAARHYEILMDQLEAKGYGHYEISNFCMPGHHSRHNMSYWQRIPYLGLGPSAHSFNGVSRQWNCSNLTQYLAALDRNELPCETEILTATDKYNEFIMTAIRTSSGVDFRMLADVFGDAAAASFLSSVEEKICKGWVEKTNGSFILTRAGKLFADRVAAELFIVGTL